jgi:hypothetical protein
MDLAGTLSVILRRANVEDQKRVRKDGRQEMEVRYTAKITCSGGAAVRWID